MKILFLMDSPEYLRFFDSAIEEPAARGHHVSLAVGWSREMLALSPFSLRLLKASFNAAEDGLSGIQQLAHDANLLFYASEEAREGRDAYRDKRHPDFGKFPKRP